MLFGRTVYSTAMMVWSFLGQVLRDGKEASCQAAVARVVNTRAPAVTPPTADTGDYCRAAQALRSGAARTQSRSGRRDAGSRPKGLAVEGQARETDRRIYVHHARHAPELAEFPHPRTQKKGVGLPIARAVAIISLATACLTDATIGPYKGKETGETALLRSMLASLPAGDIAVFDRHYCSFMMIALLQLQDAVTCTRLHQARLRFSPRHTPGKDDHLIVWTKPARPDWMDQETYDRIPETLELRELCYTSWNRAAARRRLRWSPR